MTIKIEQQALLRVLERPRDSFTSSSSAALTTSSHPPLEGGRMLEDDFVLVDLQPLGSKQLELRRADDDDTLSTASLSVDSVDCEDNHNNDPASSSRRVSFAADLVSDVWTREFTPKEDVAKLFYSTQDTARFRQEYRLERKLLSELAVDPDSFSVDDKDLAKLVSVSAPQPPYRISRVVVLHKDKLETFCDTVDNDDDAALSNQQEHPDAVFDHDSFWSGSITWY